MKKPKIPEAHKAPVITWFFEPLNASSNAMIVSLGDRIEECPDKEVIGPDKKKKKVNVFRADESSAAYIFQSSGFNRLSFNLYKQEGVDEDIIQRQTFLAKKTDPFKEARKKRAKNAKKGLVRALKGQIH